MTPDEIKENERLQEEARRRQSLAPTFDRLIQSNLDLSSAVHTLVKSNQDQIDNVGRLTRAIYISSALYLMFFIGSCLR